MLRIVFVLAGAGVAVLSAAPPAGDSPYLPVRGCAYKLALGDVTGSGRKAIVYGAYDNAVRCVDPESGKMLWEAGLGGFPFGLAVADLDGDGRAETLAACADGVLHAISPEGRVLWRFQRNSAPLYAVAVCGGRIAAGGIAREVYGLSADGRLEGVHPFGAMVNFLGTDGRRVMAVNYGDRAQWLEMGPRGPRVAGKARIPGEFTPYSLDVADLDGDGEAEAVMGTDNEGGCRVLAMKPDGVSMWLTPRWWGKPTGGWERRGIFCMTQARVAGTVPGVDGPAVVAVTSGNVRLFDRTGKMVGSADAPVAFNDLAVDGRTLWLGSTPNGDGTIYRIDLGGGWEGTVAALERRGLAAEVGANMAALRRQAEAAAPDADAAARGPYFFKVPRYNERSRKAPESLRWFAGAFPSPRFRVFTFVGWNLREDFAMNARGERVAGAAPEGGRSAAEIEDLAAAIEEDGVPMLWTVDHTTTPHVSVAALERAMAAAPERLLGFISHEDESPSRLPDYFDGYLRSLADGCVREGRGRKILLQEKNVWYFSTPPAGKVFDAMFGGGRGAVFVLGTDDANSRTPDLNLMGRAGLRQAGLARHIQASVISDSFCYNRMREWESPKSGSPMLRLLMAHTVLGADHYFFRDDYWDEGELTAEGREFADVFLPLLDKGIVFSPAPEEMAGLSRIGFAVHEPPRAWMEDGHNGHGENAWREDAVLDEGVLPRNGCVWGNAPTPAHALTAVVFHKKRQYGGFVPATPYGPVVFVPAQADLARVPGVTEWWHTDGVSVWREGGERLTGAKAAERMRAAFEAAAAALPFRAAGDDVFLHTVRLKESGYRVFLIDPGWVDPAARRVVLRAQVKGVRGLRDRLTGEAVEMRDGEARVTVPAGGFRILDAVVDGAGAAAGARKGGASTWEEGK